MNIPRRLALADGAARVHALMARFIKSETTTIIVEVLRALVVCQDHVATLFLRQR
jgi:hypothetical protein